MYLATTIPVNFEFDPTRFARAYQRLGCTHAQIYRNQDRPFDVAATRNAVRDAGLKIDSLHGLFGPDIDPSSPNDALRQRSLEVYEREGALVRSLGGWGVVVHPSWRIGERESEEEQRSRQRAWAMTLDELHRIGQKNDVVFLVENLPGEFALGSDTPGLGRGVRELGSRYVRMCLDTGHAHMVSDSHGPVASQIEACADVIGYVHVHDNDARQDDHRMPGDGSIDWSATWKALGRVTRSTLPCMLEVFHKETEVERLIDGGLDERFAQWMQLAAEE